MTFDPRAVTGIPTEPVGSLPRPQALLDAYAAYAAYDAGRIDDALDAAQDAAVRDTVGQFEATGSPIISDGEQRRGSVAGDTLSRSTGYATRPMKQAVVSPSMLALLYPERDDVSGYPREQFERDLVDECERDIRSALEAGAARVSIDVADGRLTDRNDPRAPRTGAGVLRHVTELVNRVLDRFDTRERMTIGVHTCMGADRGPAHSADVLYADLLPDVLQIDAGYFLLRLAAEFIPAEQLGSTDDCGFSPFSHDPRPLRGLPDLARGIAFRKIRSRVEGTYLAAEKIGIA